MMPQAQKAGERVVGGLQAIMKLYLSRWLSTRLTKCWNSYCRWSEGQSKLREVQVKLKCELLVPWPWPCQAPHSPVA